MPFQLPRSATAARLAVAVLMLPAVARADDGVPPVIRSAGNGPWSAPATWVGGRVPGELARVLIRPGHRVVYAVKSPAPIRAVNVAGTLTFDPDRDTRLDVGLIVIQPNEKYCEAGFDCEAHVGKLDPAAERPALEVGTPARPIGAKHAALIRLHYVPRMDRDPCPAIVCCGGRMDLHGAPIPRTWVRPGASTGLRKSDVRLGEEVPGWRVGDQPASESRTIAKRSRAAGDRLVWRNACRSLRAVSSS